MQLDTGDKLLAHPDAFTVLSDIERDYVQALREELSAFVTTSIGLAAQFAKAGEMTLPRSMLLLGGVFASQLRALRALGKAPSLPSVPNLPNEDVPR